MDKKELLKHIGSMSQIGGVRDFTFNDGKAKGVRAIEIDTGVIRFTVLPDRAMDIAQTSVCGKSVAWISKTGITSPYLYEKDGKSWLRGFYGGLITTCGLRNIGGPVGDMGLHGRIANIPAENVSVFADWVGDDYVMTVSGSMREAMVFGENLVFTRTITTKLFSDEISVCDRIVNEGYRDEEVALAYHCNFGYPLVREGARIINAPDEISYIGKPAHGIDEECIEVELEGDEPTVGIENDELAVYLTYKSDTLPKFLIWKMLGESEYVIGLEPRTSNEGGAGIREKNEYVIMRPFDEYKTELKFRLVKKN